MMGIQERYVRLEALVHLAAIPAPGIMPDHLTFMDNISCTWNVVSAARRAGVTKIVWASSETVLGPPFDTAGVHPCGRGICAAARVHIFARQDS